MTIWYDFTTTLRNQGRNGIANVEWSIGAALLADAHPPRAFALQPGSGLIEVDPSVDLATTVYASGGSGASTAQLTTETWRDTVRSVILATESRHATTAIRAISRVYQSPKQVRSGLSRRAGKVASRVAPTSMPNGPAPIRTSVTSSDVVVSMGADWDGTLVRELARLRARTGCRVVTMVYDLIPLTHTHLAFHNDPQLFADYFRALLTTSDLITCISAQSRTDLLRFAEREGLTAPPCEVLRLGENAPHAPRGDEVDDFYLWVGTVERRKNLELLYDALRIIESEGGTPPRIVVAGAAGWGVTDLIDELDQQATPASRAIWRLGSVDEATLEGLYGRARALVFPSHYEGWGLPVREAAVRGLPVAAGDSPAVREAAEGYPGATLLPTDDPGPWARYLLAEHPRATPAPHRAWSSVAGDLRGFIDRADVIAPRR